MASPAKAEQLPTEFSQARLTRRFRPRPPSHFFGWDLDRARDARDAQMRGNYRVSAELAEATKIEPAIYAALLNRVTPHRGLPRVVRYSETTSGGGRRLLKEARHTFRKDGTAFPAGPVADSFERVAMLGQSVSQNIWNMREGSTRLDVHLEPWPMQHVYFDELAGQLLACTEEGLEPIVHGDGKWVVAELHSCKPWEWGAVKALAMPWSDLTFAKRDRAQHAEIHGLGKFVAELPPGFDMKSDEAALVDDLLQALETHQAGGVVPSGTIIKLLESMAAGWQIFRESISQSTSDAARVLLGQDSTITNAGGNYIKAAQLFGVSQNIAEGDLGAQASAMTTGTMRPWSIFNIGEDVGLETAWLFPDPDEDARRSALAKRVSDYNGAIAAYRANGFIVDQEVADRLAEDYGVPRMVLEPAAPAPAPAPDVDPGPNSMDSGRDEADQIQL